MLARCRELVEKVTGADGQGGWYGDFQFHRVYHAVNEFCIVDLSAFYLDVLKDRLYTFAPQSVERRSTQTVLWRIAEALVRLLAPILTFTSDEVWQYLPAVPDRPASVHLAAFPKTEELGTADAQLMEDWHNVMQLRDEVLLKLEEFRRDKKIGKSLEAKVSIALRGDPLSALKLSETDLKELFNVSQVAIQTADDPDASSAATIAIGAASGHKCNRCWNYYADDSPQHVRRFGAWENVCGRCADALRAMGYNEDPQ
jgi:isoleucyl-tRNA synthetase